MSDVFVDALRYPFADRARVDGTATCLVALLVGGTLLRLAARLWPDLTFLAPALAAVVPLVVFLGLVGGVLAGDGFPPLATTETLRLAGRVVGVAAVYLLPAAVTVVAVGYVTATGSIPAVLTGVTTAMLATVALLVTVVCAYLFPAATAVSVHEGLRAGLRRDALRGAASGTYFFAWVGAAVLVVLAWSALAATISRSVAALLALGWCAYAHVAAAALVAEGVGRTTPW
ncbi:hypothetical protein G3A49_02735 [Haloferax volcanii]|uniref:Uncharacterized protein n=3 Tax=Haloferax TaxID=2251 RepID=A0ACD5HX75_9EURY|nr:MULTISPECIES: hypothetical protein [Haloferax]MBC9985338.1 hypothetical protein [Haloferax sp. AS1]ELK51522.1 hypothetical protein D320_15130 [Haloferax sp. BAB-2207]ELZ70616.1 hypothetical protein C456_15637 [Haloferax lucentense DSM 14919]QIB77119.1 hypothetical protein G3A49_02735 [Haloferax alexandrinus]RDZ33268.1 hypothetical protein DEQ67_05760 [Haloferax sp. Atlit-48N]